MEKQELKEKIDQIARQNCKSWENDENAAACETAICCIVRDIKKSIDEMTEIEDKKMILRLKNGEKLEIREYAGMAEIILQSRDNEEKRNVLVSGDFIADVLFNLE